MNEEEDYEYYQLAYYNNLSEEELIEVINNGNPINFIGYIKNPSEAVQLEAVRNFNYNFEYLEEYVKIWIKSDEALLLFNKLKSIHEIIK